MKDPGRLDTRVSGGDRRYDAALRAARAIAVATTASAAASDTCRVVEDRRVTPQSGQRWSDVFTGSLQFGQSVRAMAPPERRGRGVTIFAMVPEGRSSVPDYDDAGGRS